MKSRYGRVVRLLGVALLLLAVSPLTAPFATCDLIDILGGATAPAATSVQAKKAVDEPAAELGTPDGFAAVFTVTRAGQARELRNLRGAAPLDVPLRI